MVWVISLRQVWGKGIVWSMPRKMRVEYPVAIYHVMSRGDRREDIFLDDVDRQDFLKTLAEACRKTGFQVHLKRNFTVLAVKGAPIRANVNRYKNQTRKFLRLA